MGDPYCSQGLQDVLPPEGLDGPFPDRRPEPHPVLLVNAVLPQRMEPVPDPWLPAAAEAVGEEVGDLLVAPGRGRVFLDLVDGGVGADEEERGVGEVAVPGLRKVAAGRGEAGLDVDHAGTRVRKAGVGLAKGQGWGSG